MCVQWAKNGKIVQEKLCFLKFFFTTLGRSMRKNVSKKRRLQPLRKHIAASLNYTFSNFSQCTVVCVGLMGCPIFEAPWLVEETKSIGEWWGRPLKWLRKQMFILSWIIWIIKDSFGTIINVCLCYCCSHFSSVTKYFHNFWGTTTLRFQNS